MKPVLNLSRDGAGVPGMEARTRVIRHGRIEHVRWFGFAALAALPPDGQVLTDQPGWVLPLALWKACRTRLRGRLHPPAVWMAADTDPDALRESGRLIFLPGAVVFLAIDFPVCADTRGLALARTLRDRLGWQGELRAVGEVTVDAVARRSQAGFDSFTVKPGHDPLLVLAALAASGAA